jgi:anti-sigma-K factor RskA
MRTKDNHMSMNESHHVTDLLDAYALGALEADEVAQVEAHLERCPQCRVQAETARATAQQLLVSAPLVTPPPDLKARVLARVHAVAAEDRTIAEAVTPSHARPETTRRRHMLRRMLDTMLGSEPLNPADPVAALLLKLLVEPSCELVGINATPAAPKNAIGRLVYVPNDREAVLVTAGMRNLAPDQAYQVWLLHDGQPEPNTLFRVAGGHGFQIVQAPTPLRDFDVLAVTPEPAGGSLAPTGPIVLMGSLSAS